MHLSDGIIKTRINIGEGLGKWSLCTVDGDAERYGYHGNLKPPVTQGICFRVFFQMS